MNVQILGFSTHSLRRSRSVAPDTRNYLTANLQTGQNIVSWLLAYILLCLNLKRRLSVLA